MHHHPIDMLPRSGSGKERDDEPPAVGLAVPVRFVRDGPASRATCPHCAGELELSTIGSSWQVHRPSEVADRLAVQLGALEREELHVLLLNTRNVVVDQVRVYQGNVSASLVRVAELFTEAVRRQARAVLLVHNHPSGDPTPSPDDLHLTAEATAAGKLLDIAVLDHVIIAGGRFASLRDVGLISEKVGGRPSAHERSHLRTKSGDPSGQTSGNGGESHQLRLFGAARGLHLQGQEVVGPDGAKYSVADAIRRLPWRSALPGGGMPAHQYVVLGQCDALAADVLDCVIRKSPDAYNAYFRGYQHPMRYVEIDGWRFWRTRLNKTHMLNRCTLDSVEPPRRVDQGAKRIPWDGPPWAPNGSPWPPGYIEVGGKWVYRRELDPRRGFTCAGCGRSYWLSAPDRPCPRCGRVAESQREA